MKLGILEKLYNLRLIWKNEATDFTPWLALEDNIATLGEELGLDISEIQTELSVGGFSADIVAKETSTEKIIVIENQLEDSDHDHLGKIITYASGTEANIIIWIVRKAREEHRKAIEWLNNNMGDDVDFFLIQIELWKIGDSLVAPKFHILEKPNIWAKEIKRSSRDMNETQAFKLEYWTEFNEYAFEDIEFSRIFNKRKASTDHWYSVKAGSSEFHFNFLINTLKNIISVDCYIHNNKNLYHHFYSFKDEIEEIVGFKLVWLELPERKASRVLIEKKVDLRNIEKRNSQFDWFKEYGIKFYQAFKKYE